MRNSNTLHILFPVQRHVNDHHRDFYAVVELL